MLENNSEASLANGGNLMSLLALRVEKLLKGLTASGYRRALLSGVLPSIEHGPAFRGRRFDCVVDVGANKGQFAAFARNCFPQCRIVSFEPLDRPARIYESLFHDDTRTRLVRAAVATERGSVLMHVTAKDDSSSPLAVGKLQTQAFGSVVVDTIEVPCGPLSDYLLDDDLGQENLLKVDTQGFELQVLRGADGLLDRFSAIYCELSFKELYVGQSLASEVIAHLFHRQFSLAGVYNLTSDRNLGQLQADMLFVRLQKI
jgi:FkbM family methyltransferase